MHVVDDEIATAFDDGPVLSAGCKRVVAQAVRHILEAVGEDPAREGLAQTPARVARMYDELLVGYTQDPMSVLNGALFEVEYDEMVVVSDIEFYSLCEHHLLPFSGTAHVAYLPDKRVVGLSKIPRIVDVFARRLQVQERMTQQIADFLQAIIAPKGVAVVVDAVHLCVAMRGVRKANARMRTSALLGAFREDEKTRAEFFNHIDRGGGTVRG
ncbi:MAG: GTP cyclohydrolase I FolE [Armatimonadota bacterium]|nr:GTP cyclohydrolase I FolE [Armatimonadota bacterium]